MSNSFSWSRWIKSLKELMEAEVVSRVQYNEVPLRVEYSLTNHGKELVESLVPVTLWSEHSIQIHKLKNN